MIRRLTFLRTQRCELLRFFSSSKDTESLKKQFVKLAEEMNLNIATDTKSNDEIKMKDQIKMTEDLKAQFKGIKEDLSKQTGQAKTAQERLKESFQNFSMPKFSMPDFSKWKNPIQPDKISEIQPEKEEAKPNENLSQSTQEASGSENIKKDEEIPKPAKTPYYEKYPKLKFLHITTSYIKDAIKETFPDQEYKINLMKENARIQKEKEEELKKWLEEHPGDENIPEWKKGALSVAQKKRTKWEKIKDSVIGSKIGSKVSESTQTILKQDSVKKAKENIQDIKEGIQSIGLDIKDSIQMSDSRLVQSGRELLSQAAVESAQAKAVKVFRAYDPDFDIYQLENDLEHIVVDFYQQFLDLNKEYVQKITEGPAREFLMKILANKSEGLDYKQEVYEVTRPVFLGVNLEEKQNPRLSFSCTVKYSGGNNSQDKEARISRVKSHKVNYFFMISRHPEPDFETYGHPWQFLVFQPSDDQLRLGG
ncbi:unnamed protein product [Blepharisma stoltei]|uniref:Mitochondrial import inner membrane translocase subunit TIM44 n=1 Tax=Blepharisma stoltei TaxID=1481888 RepID=A0AAU9K4R2_9CILI|nr:unnamed protein product [Blepharisma stoltei]